MSVDNMLVINNVYYVATIESFPHKNPWQHLKKKCLSPKRIYI